MVFLLPLRCLVTSLLIPLLGFIRPVLPQKVVMAADPPYNKDVTTMYLWDPHWRNVRRPYDDNSIWLVFSKWNSASGCQENKAVRPFRSESSVSTDTETGAWEYDTRPAPVLNKEGTWARIGQWADETQSWDKALTIQYKTRLNPLYGHTRAQPEELDWSFYDVRAHLKGTLTKWTSSGKMKSTDEEKIVWVKFLQQGTGMHHGLPGGNFLGIPRLAPYPDRITYYIWKAPVSSPGGFWLVAGDWRERTDGGMRGHNVVFRFRPDSIHKLTIERYTDPSLEDLDNILINNGGEWVRIGYVDRKDGNAVEHLKDTWWQHHVGGESKKTKNFNLCFGASLGLLPQLRTVQKSTLYPDAFGNFGPY